LKFHAELGVRSITGSDILMDGGVTATYCYGELDEVRCQSWQRTKGN